VALKLDHSIIFMRINYKNVNFIFGTSYKRRNIKMIALHACHSEGEVLNRIHVEIGVSGELPVLAGKKHGLGTEVGRGVCFQWHAAHITGLRRQGDGAR
jgi:hypothetical protein